MASFLPRRPPAAERSLEESAMWRARVEFELLKLLAPDRKALATARRRRVASAGRLPCNLRQSRKLHGKLLGRLLLLRRSRRRGASGMDTASKGARSTVRPRP